MKIFPPHLIDFYKSGHPFQYPPGTELVYSNFTPRSARLFGHDLSIGANVNGYGFDGKVVFFGLQGVMQWLLIDLWNRCFFQLPENYVANRYQRRMDKALGPGAVTVNHIRELHRLGYLPLHIKALPEGSRVNMRVPLFTIRNTLPEFFWLTNYVETMLSAECWKSTTTATIAYQYRRLLEHFAQKTGAPREFIDWQGHDFSMRGQSGVHDAAQSGSGHLLPFTGTDTVPALDYLEDYYDAENEFIGGSVPATEHSVMCMGGQETEIETFRRLLKTYPSGVVSIVSDTWDFFNVITNIAAELKWEIESRKPDALGLAKVVFRPDSGDPVKIVCGDPDAPEGRPQYKGAVQCLWEVFGGTVNSRGYRELNPRVGLIYGDSITLHRAEAILARLERSRFASSNIVFGIGSYTYQHVTRDTFGHAIKATLGIVDGVERELFKDPATDSGTKKSAKGWLRVEKINDDFYLFDQQTKEREEGGMLSTVFLDGVLHNKQTLAEIRARLLGG